MKIFIDTADIEEIRKAQRMGMVDGVTTNPTLIAQTGREFMEVLQEICREVDGPISAEVVSVDSKGMVEEARELARVSSNIVIKIPMTVEGLIAIRELTNEGIKTNCTLIFSPAQSLLAAKAGATYVSPFVGRLDDISTLGMELVEKSLHIFDIYGYETEVIVASIRSPLHVVDSAMLGADVATIPYKVIEQLAKHPLTDIGIEKFLADWDKVPK
jgi:transaldolase